MIMECQDTSSGKVSYPKPEEDFVSGWYLSNSIHTVREEVVSCEWSRRTLKHTVSPRQVIYNNERVH